MPWEELSSAVHWAYKSLTKKNVRCGGTFYAFISNIFPDGRSIISDIEIRTLSKGVSYIRLPNSQAGASNHIKLTALHQWHCYTTSNDL
jgi:hypothetical protein